MTTPTFSDARPRLGETKADLETPVVVADLDGVEQNLRRYADLADANDVGLRVHTKAHKIPELARRQQSLAPDGVLCQKLGEAEVMVRDGIDDILLVCPVVSEPKLERVVWLAEKCEQFAMVVDGPGNVDPLAEVAAAHGTTVDVVMEVDAGLRRMGVQPGDETVAFGEHVRDLEGVGLHGILGHDAHLPFIADDEADLEELCADTAATLGETASRLEGEVGFSDLEVTSGASATAPHMAEQDAITELDPGRYVFNDVDTLLRAPHVGKEDCTLTVVTTVIAKPTEDRAICDAGSKTISYNTDAPDPVPKGRDDVGFPGRSSEHGHLDVSDAPEVSVGDRLEFVVPNAYGPINLHDTIPAIRDGEVRELWNVEARGKDK
jgi:D-serine deaminase-like pyridoxal phosphate-dependent protein